MSAATPGEADIRLASALEQSELATEMLAEQQAEHRPILEGAIAALQALDHLDADTHEDVRAELAGAAALVSSHIDDARTTAERLLADAIANLPAAHDRAAAGHPATLARAAAAIRVAADVFENVALMHQLLVGARCAGLIR